MAKKKTKKKATAPITRSPVHEARPIRELGRVKPDLAVFIWSSDPTLVKAVADDLSKAIELDYHYDLHKRSGLGAEHGS